MNISQVFEKSIFFTKFRFITRTDRHTYKSQNKMNYKNHANFHNFFPLLRMTLTHFLLLFHEAPKIKSPRNNFLKICDCYRKMISKRTSSASIFKRPLWTFNLIEQVKIIDFFFIHLFRSNDVRGPATSFELMMLFFASLL